MILRLTRIRNSQTAFIKQYKKLFWWLLCQLTGIPFKNKHPEHFLLLLSLLNKAILMGVFFGGGVGRGWGVVVVMGSVGKGYFRPIPVRGIMIQLSMCSQPQLLTSGSKCYELTVTFNIQPKKGSVEYWWIVLKYFQKFSVWFCFSKNNTYENFGFFYSVSLIEATWSGALEKSQDWV